MVMIEDFVLIVGLLPCIQSTDNTVLLTLPEIEGSIVALMLRIPKVSLNGKTLKYLAESQSLRR